MEEKKTDRYLTTVENYKKALAALRLATQTPIKEPRDLSGIIKDFELTYELGWKCLKKFLENQGHETTSAREAFSKAYELGLIDSEKTWLSVLKDRNLTVHTYNQQFAEEMCKRIKDHYVVEFSTLEKLFK